MLLDIDVARRPSISQLCVLAFEAHRKALPRDIEMKKVSLTRISIFFISKKKFFFRFFTVSKVFDNEFFQFPVKTNKTIDFAVIRLGSLLGIMYPTHA